MQTNIAVDADLVSQVMRSSGAATEEAAVEAALKLMLKIRGQESIRELRGKVKWEGNLEESRRGRNVG